MPRQSLRYSLCALLLLLFPLLAFSAAQAQTSPAAPASGTPVPEAVEPGQAAADTQALIRLLEDDAARASLIQRLRADAPAATEDQAASPVLVQSIAEHTRALAEQASGVFLLGGDAIRRAGALVRDMDAGDARRLGRSLSGIAGCIAVTLLAYWVLRALSIPVMSALDKRGIGRRLPHRLLLLIGAAGVEALVLALAWGTGTAFGLMFGAAGRIGLDQSLFLNAFLAAGLVKMVARLILMPHAPNLRLPAMSDTTAHYWLFWTARIANLTAFTFLFVAPMVAWNVSPAAAEAVRIIAVFTACVIVIVLVLQNKSRVRTLLMRRVAHGKTDALARFYAIVGRFWHVIAIIYVVALFLIWIANPDGALAYMLGATAQTLIAIALGILVTGFISRIISGGLRLSPDLRTRLPLLETRLNAFVPTVLSIVRLLVLAAVVIAIAQAWALADVAAWATSAAGLRILSALISAALIVVGGFVIYVAVSSWIEYRLNPEVGRVPSPRERTLLSLLRNAFTIVLALMVGMLALGEIGVNIAPLLAGAGVIGLAVGFGAQKLVQDVITGIFIQLENAMNEGDVVSAGGVSGVVERLTIRSVAIRDLQGVYHIVPFSSVDKVSNMMRHFAYHVADIGVAYRERIPEVKEAMHAAFERLAAGQEGASVIGLLDMWGVNELGDSAVVVRARIKTLPGKQWAVGRAYNEFVKEVFDERGIEIPFPHMTIWAGEDKDGSAPPLRLARTG